MDFNNVTKGKAIPLGIIIIVLTYLLSGASSSILPFVFFTGILVGLMKHDNITESAVAALLVALIGSVISTIITSAIIYISYGSTYLAYTLTSSLYLVIFYIIAGAIGGVIGYYIFNELDVKH
ncbi:MULTISPECIES: DUF5518 domain-containing protein [Methanosphaera]|uniref:DUF5518 domain-containing protein n=1 Tax=Methanosphaera TaxID=2316 RepID=UPI002666CFA0|nr:MULTISPECIES: DUF5518 domain-containing protein [Methanosphaera]MDO5821431.1 DUF5518 domain-containing protein [Methanosphaera sp.]